MTMMKPSSDELFFLHHNSSSSSSSSSLVLSPFAPLDESDTYTADDYEEDVDALIMEDDESVRPPLFEPFVAAVKEDMDSEILIPLLPLDTKFTNFIEVTPLFHIVQVQ